MVDHAISIVPAHAEAEDQAPGVSGPTVAREHGKVLTSCLLNRFRYVTIPHFPSPGLRIDVRGAKKERRGKEDGQAGGETDAQLPDGGVGDHSAPAQKVEVSEDPAHGRLRMSPSLEE